MIQTIRKCDLIRFDSKYSFETLTTIKREANNKFFYSYLFFHPASKLYNHPLVYIHIVAHIVFIITLHSCCSFVYVFIVSKLVWFGQIRISQITICYVSISCIFFLYFMEYSQCTIKTIRWGCMAYKRDRSPRFKCSQLKDFHVNPTTINWNKVHKSVSIHVLCEFVWQLKWTVVEMKSS